MTKYNPPTLFTIWNSGGCVAVLSHMNFYYMFLLLLVVLSAYSESPQQGEPPDPLDLTVVAVCPNSSSDSLGVLAPVLSQNEMSGSVLFQTIVLPQSEVFGSQNMILPQNEVFRTVLLQNEAFEIVLPQNEMNISVPLQGGIFRVVIVNWKLFSEVKAIIDFVGVKSIKKLTSTLVNSVTSP